MFSDAQKSTYTSALFVLRAVTRWTVYCSLQNFKITSRLMNLAPKAFFLHCLPRGEEVSNEVFYGNKSKVWQQALNRVYVQKSILLYCFDRLR